MNENQNQQGYPHRTIEWYRNQNYRDYRSLQPIEKHTNKL